MEEGEPGEKRLLPPAGEWTRAAEAPQADKPGPSSALAPAPAQPPLGLVPLLRPPAGLGSQAWRPQAPWGDRNRTPCSWGARGPWRR